MKYDNSTRVETAVKSYISEYKISKLLFQIPVEASRCYNQMITPVVVLNIKIYLVLLTAARLSGIV